MDRQSGAAAVEYALLVGLIAVVILGAVGALGMAIFPPERVERIVDAIDGQDPSESESPPAEVDCTPWPGGGNSQPPPDAGFC
jgi:hypothetical protein